MYYAITIFMVIIAALLVLLIMVQKSKGGGLASSFQSSNQFMGVAKTNDFIEKATWVLAIGLLVLCIATNFSIKGMGPSVKEGKMKDVNIEQTTPGNVSGGAVSPGSGQNPNPPGK